MPHRLAIETIMAVAINSVAACAIRPRTAIGCLDSRFWRNLALVARLPVLLVGRSYGSPGHFSSHLWACASERTSGRLALEYGNLPSIPSDRPIL